jgi:hypothetical protein
VEVYILVLFIACAEQYFVDDIPDNRWLSTGNIDAVYHDAVRHKLIDYAPEFLVVKRNLFF